MSLAPAELDRLRGRINARLGEIYPQGPGLLKEPVHYALAGKGKRLRPILTLLASQSLGGTVEGALHAAVAVEMLHNFTLVHDDIMDRDGVRHGQASVHARWDDGVALLTGDAMLVLAMTELRLSPAHGDALMSSFTQGALAVCEGQALDKEYEDRPQVALDDYLRMIDLKTGYMLGMASELGAIAAGADIEQSNNLRRFGQLLGRAFQVQDDLLEIFSDTQTMGKSLGSDILSEKKTYLMVIALEKFPDKVRQAIEAARTDMAAALEDLRRLYDDEGIRDRAEKSIVSMIAEAKGHLETAGPESQVLADFADLVLERDR